MVVVKDSSYLATSWVSQRAGSGRCGRPVPRMGGHLIGTLLRPRGLARPWRCLSGLRQATRVHLLPSDPGPRFRHSLPFSGAASVIAPLQLSSTDWYTLVTAPGGVESRSGTWNPSSLAPPSVQGAKTQRRPPGPSLFRRHLSRGTNEPQLWTGRAGKRLASY